MTNDIMTTCLVWLTDEVNMSQKCDYSLCPMRLVAKTNETSRIDQRD